MKTLKNQLIRLGYQDPSLRDHLRPIIAAVDMRSDEALKMDKGKGEFYVEWDDSVNDYCVFGTESGFAYFCGDEYAAQEEADRMNRVYSRTASMRRRARDFDQWMRKVDRHIQRKVGMSYRDLPDARYRDWFNDGVGPKEAANMALEYAGFGGF